MQSFLCVTWQSVPDWIGSRAGALDRAGGGEHAASAAAHSRFLALIRASSVLAVANNRMG